MIVLQITDVPQPNKIVLSGGCCYNCIHYVCRHMNNCKVSFSEFTVLLKLRHQSENLVRCRDDFILQVKCTVL